MNKSSSSDILRGLLWVFIFVQIAFSLYITVNYLIKSSNLKYWLDANMTRTQKLDLILGGDYPVLRQFSTIPEDAGILIVSSDTIWFSNYYFLPRRMYKYNDVSKDEDLKVPKKWLKEKNIEYLFLYHIPLLKVMKVNKKKEFE
jgi:hypothetical protein